MKQFTSLVCLVLAITFLSAGGYQTGGSSTSTTAFPSVSDAPQTAPIKGYKLQNEDDMIPRVYVRFDDFRNDIVTSVTPFINAGCDISLAVNFGNWDTADRNRATTIIGLAAAAGVDIEWLQHGNYNFDVTAANATGRSGYTDTGDWGDYDQLTYAQWVEDWDTGPLEAFVGEDVVGAVYPGDNGARIMEYAKRNPDFIKRMMRENGLKYVVATFSSTQVDTASAQPWDIEGNHWGPAFTHGVGNTKKYLYTKPFMFANYDNMQYLLDYAPSDAGNGIWVERGDATSNPWSQETVPWTFANDTASFGTVDDNYTTDNEQAFGFRTAYSRMIAWGGGGGFVMHSEDDYNIGNTVKLNFPTGSAQVTTGAIYPEHISYHHMASVLGRLRDFGYIKTTTVTERIRWGASTPVAGLKIDGFDDDTDFAFIAIGDTVGAHNALCKGQGTFNYLGSSVPYGDIAQIAIENHTTNPSRIGKLDGFPEQAPSSASWIHGTLSSRDQLRNGIEYNNSFQVKMNFNYSFQSPGRYRVTLQWQGTPNLRVNQAIITYAVGSMHRTEGVWKADGDPGQALDGIMAQVYKDTTITIETVVPIKTYGYDDFNFNQVGQGERWLVYSFDIDIPEDSSVFYDDATARSTNYSAPFSGFTDWGYATSGQFRFMQPGTIGDNKTVIDELSIVYLGPSLRR